jgi:hypothetical protein
MESPGAAVSSPAPTCAGSRGKFDDAIWSRCAHCSLTWVSFAPEETVPWSGQARSLRIYPALNGVGPWLATLPLAALGAAAAFLPLWNLVTDGADWVGLLGLVGAPLGGWWCWEIWLSPATRFVLGWLLPDRVVVSGESTRLVVRAEGWRRSDISFSTEEFTEVMVSRAQGSESHICLAHRTGPSILLTTQPNRNARATARRIAGET